MEILKSAYSNIPDGLRLFLQEFLLKIAVSSFLVTIFVKLSTYLYAWQYGARMPFEGIQFVPAIIIFISVIISIVSLIGMFLSRTADKIGKDTTLTTKDWLLNTLAGTLITIAALMLAALLKLSFNFPSIVIYFAMALISITIYFFSDKIENSGQVFGWAIYTICIILLALGLTLGSLFPHLLKITKYGGGQLIFIETIDETKSIKRHEGHLFLSTKSSVVIWDNKKIDGLKLKLDRERAKIEGYEQCTIESHIYLGAFKEFNRSHIYSITVPQDSIVKLPPKVSLREMFFNTQGISGTQSRCTGKTPTPEVENK